MLADGTERQGGTIEFLILTDEAFDVEVKDTAEVSVDFAELVIGKKARVRDLWEGKDLGTFEGSFSRELKCHDAGVYRISPVD